MTDFQGLVAVVTGGAGGIGGQPRVCSKCAVRVSRSWTAVRTVHPMVCWPCAATSRIPQPSTPRSRQPEQRRGVGPRARRQRHRHRSSHPRSAAAPAPITACGGGEHLLRGRLHVDLVPLAVIPASIRRQPCRNSASLSVGMQKPSAIACEALRVANKSTVS